MKKLITIPYDYTYSRLQQEWWDDLHSTDHISWIIEQFGCVKCEEKHDGIARMIFLTFDDESKASFFIMNYL